MYQIRRKRRKYYKVAMNQRRWYLGEKNQETSICSLKINKVHFSQQFWTFWWYYPISCRQSQVKNGLQLGYLRASYPPEENKLYDQRLLIQSGRRFETLPRYEPMTTVDAEEEERRIVQRFWEQGRRFETRPRYESLETKTRPII